MINCLVLPFVVQFILKNSSYLLYHSMYVYSTRNRIYLSGKEKCISINIWNISNNKMAEQKFIKKKDKEIIHWIEKLR